MKIIYLSALSILLISFPAGAMKDSKASESDLKDIQSLVWASDGMKFSTSIGSEKIFLDAFMNKEGSGVLEVGKEKYTLDLDTGNSLSCLIHYAYPCFNVRDHLLATGSPLFFDMIRLLHGKLTAARKHSA